LLTQTSTKEVQAAELLILLNRARELKQKVNDWLFKNPGLLKYIPATDRKDIQ